MQAPIAILGSMATRGLLIELAAAWDGNATIRSVGGVEAARLVRGGEPVDVVVLAGPAMDKLQADGFILPGSLTGIAVSSMVAAVRAGGSVPPLSDADDLKRALLAANHIGYSTGPSGDHLLRLIDDWDLRKALQARLVQAPPGMPVGRLLAEDKVDLGFQQRSELMNVEGVIIAGPLPPAIAADTLFTAGVVCSANQHGEARRFVDFLNSAETIPVKLQHGVKPA